MNDLPIKNIREQKGNVSNTKYERFQTNFGLKERCSSQEKIRIKTNNDVDRKSIEQ